MKRKTRARQKYRILADTNGSASESFIIYSHIERKKERVSIFHHCVDDTDIAKGEILAIDAVVTSELKKLSPRDDRECIYSAVGHTNSDFIPITMDLPARPGLSSTAYRGES